MRAIDKKYRSDDALSALQELVLARIRTLPEKLDAGFGSAVPFAALTGRIRWNRSARASGLAPTCASLIRRTFRVMNYLFLTVASSRPRTSPRSARGGHLAWFARGMSARESAIGAKSTR